MSALTVGDRVQSVHDEDSGVPGTVVAIADGHAQVAWDDHGLLGPTALGNLVPDGDRPHPDPDAWEPDERTCWPARRVTAAGRLSCGHGTHWRLVGVLVACRECADEDAQEQREIARYGRAGMEV